MFNTWSCRLIFRTSIGCKWIGGSNSFFACPLNNYLGVLCSARQVMVRGCVEVVTRSSAKKARKLWTMDYRTEFREIPVCDRRQQMTWFSAAVTGALPVGIFPLTTVKAVFHHVPLCFSLLVRR